MNGSEQGALEANSACTSNIPVDFKSTLPPRKRAKTKEEKEQRRIERILRNRRAAHQSREKKRLQLQHLERKAALLEQILSCKDVAKLVQSSKELSTMYEEYQSLSVQTADSGACSHDDDDEEVATGGHRTPESLSSSSSLSAAQLTKLTPVSNSVLSSPAAPEKNTELLSGGLHPDISTDTARKPFCLNEVSSDSSVLNPLLDFPGVEPENNAATDLSNWNLLLTNGDEISLPHSFDEHEYPVLDMTDNSWGLDPLRNPAVIKLSLSLADK
ncbi:LADA_0C11408g1_1 [Lachancea dasiensis]|uniref:LADA_0C11408g1_1 n=1 Tax=Lachancea dasiensis TaxID=1072105 RepID=A0A1G4J1K6_9SACH|nr:LADA_0C11408g1_1 [Lachancea dasiensis]